MQTNIIEAELKNDSREVCEKAWSYQAEKTDNGFNEYFIGNAGLVILFPFLRQMFSNLDLCRNKQFRSEYSQIRAVLLSQYLIAGSAEIAEHELLLNKILCGFPL